MAEKDDVIWFWPSYTFFKPIFDYDHFVDLIFIGRHSLGPPHHVPEPHVREIYSK